MKLTGLGLMALGALVGLYALFVALPSDSGAASTAEGGSAGGIRADVTILSVVSAVCLLGGAWLAIFGWGVIRTRNPAVRN